MGYPISSRPGMQGSEERVACTQRLSSLVDPRRPNLRNLGNEICVRTSLVFGLFNRSPLGKWQKQHEALVTRAFHAQRNGNIRLYSTLTAEADALSQKIDALKNDHPQ
jgi:hypothetical protein